MVYDYIKKCITIVHMYGENVPFTPHFDSDEAVERAIDAYHDELIWYFTEYKDSL